MHAADSASKYSLSLHSWHAVLSALGAAAAGHDLQAVAPNLAYVPGLHTAQSLVLLTPLARPAGHCWHNVAPASLNVPLSHVAHWMAPAFENMPGPHLGHESAVPFALVARPASQTLHVGFLELE